jgi:hypothetical protein
LIDWMFLMVASSLGPHWALEHDESKRLNTAINNVARHYLIFQTERSRDWGALLIVGAQIAGPRLWQTMQSPRPVRNTRQAASPTQNQPRGNGQSQAPPMPQTPTQLDPGAMAASHATAPAV